MHIEWKYLRCCVELFTFWVNLSASRRFEEADSIDSAVSIIAGSVGSAATMQSDIESAESVAWS